MRSAAAVCCAVIAVIGRHSFSVLAFMCRSAAAVKKFSPTSPSVVYRNAAPTSSRDGKSIRLQVRRTLNGGAMELKRSWMFVPGHRQKMVDKALGLNADAIMLDIEDGVAPNEKNTARRQIAEGLNRERAAKSPVRFVRINAIGHPRMDADIEAVLRPGL